MTKENAHKNIVAVKITRSHKEIINLGEICMMSVFNPSEEEKGNSLKLMVHLAWLAVSVYMQCYLDLHQHAGHMGPVHVPGVSVPGIQPEK